MSAQGTIAPRFIDPETLAIARLVARATGATLEEALADQAELFQGGEA